MKYLFPVMLVLAACGSASDGGNKADAPVTSKQAQEEEKKEEGPAAPDKAPVPYSITADSASQMPACNEAHNRQLVYILDVKKFQTCKDGSWVDVELPAPTVAKPTRDQVHLAMRAIKVGQTLDTMTSQAREIIYNFGKLGTGSTTITSYDIESGSAPIDCATGYDYFIDFNKADSKVLDVVDMCDTAYQPS